MFTKAILLDGVGAAILIVPLAFIVHFIFTIFIEGAILKAFKYGDHRKSRTNAFMANLCSLIVGIVLIRPFSQISNHLEATWMKGIDLTVIVALFYIQTIFVEGIVLKLSNRNFKTSKLILPVILMNLATYIPAYLLLRWIETN